MKTISRIAYSNDKKNKTRSILIMMSICLTTMLLVIISTVGNGMIRLQKSQAAGSYGSNYGLFVAADASQLKEVSRRAEIDAMGILCTEGIIKGNEKGGFVCMDETARKMLATVYKGNIIKNLIMDCQSYTKYRPNETTGGIFVSWRRKEELPTGA